MKHRYLVEIDMDPMMTIDAASDVEAIQGAVWEMFAHLPRKAIQVTPAPERDARLEDLFFDFGKAARLAADDSGLRNMAKRAAEALILERASGKAPEPPIYFEGTERPAWQRGWEARDRDLTATPSPGAATTGREETFGKRENIPDGQWILTVKGGHIDMLQTYFPPRCPEEAGKEGSGAAAGHPAPQARKCWVCFDDQGRIGSVSDKPVIEELPTGCAWVRMVEAPEASAEQGER